MLKNFFGVIFSGKTKINWSGDLKLLKDAGKEFSNLPLDTVYRYYVETIEQKNSIYTHRNNMNALIDILAVIRRSLENANGAGIDFKLSIIVKDGLSISLISLADKITNKTHFLCSKNLNNKNFPNTIVNEVNLIRKMISDYQKSKPYVRR